MHNFSESYYVVEYEVVLIWTFKTGEEQREDGVI